MMKNKTITEKDALLQELPLSQLKVYVDRTSFSTIENKVEEPVVAYLSKDAALQNMAIQKLKTIAGKALYEIPLVEKVAKTGLSESSIQKIETNKNKATLEEIIAYCQGLEIRIRDFLPELFM